MFSQCEFEIFSEDYVGYLFREGVFFRQNIEQLPEQCITPINSKWFIAYVKLKSTDRRTFEDIRYQFLPRIYGLSDLSAAGATGVLAVRDIPSLGFFGAGRYIAIIDTGINWRHEAFINENNTSKIEVMWDQKSNSVYYNEDFNRALKENDNTIPSDDIGHGTFMAGIAAGRTKRESNFTGVAPEARLIVVKLRQARQFLRDFLFIREGAYAYSEDDIMRGVAFVSEYANLNRYTVSYVLGMGTNLGAHTGMSPLGDILGDEAEVAGRCVSLAVGNEGNERLHFAGNILNANPQRVEIRVGEGEKGFVCELWSFAPEVYSVEIISPSGQLINRVPVRTQTSTIYSFLFENTTIEVYYQLYESNSGQNLMAIRFSEPAPGIWTLNVYGRDINTGKYNIWINNRDFLSGETFFISSDPYETITNPANNSQCISVTAYNHKNNTAYINAGRGFNGYGAIKPDFAAPGIAVVGPSNIGRDNYVTRSGTSVATAFYGGFAALIQEYGVRRGENPYFRTSEIKNITISGCTRKEGITYPDRIWGYGSINLYNSIERLRLE